MPAPARLTLSGVNTLTGPITVTQGTLVAGNASALGSAAGGTIVQSGAALDVNGLNLGAEPVTASGAGVGGAGGAIVNNGAQIYPALRTVTLAGHTTFGGANRWDIRYTSTGATDPALSSLSTGGNAYNLTKVGANYVGICNVTVDPALANVDIQEGTLSLQYNTTSLGNPANTVSVAANAYLNFYNLTNLLDKKIVLADLANVSTASGAGANTVAGPVTLNGIGLFTMDGTSSLTLNGALNGPGSLSKNGVGTLVINGDGSGLTGGVNVNGGTFAINGVLGGGLTNQGGSTLMGGGTNNGFLEAYGNIAPGASNVVGTLTVGGAYLQNGTVVYDLTYANTPGAGVNDLVMVKGDLTVNGGTISINPVGLLQMGVPYRLFTYTGNLNWISDLSVPDQNGYSFTLDKATPGQVNLVVTARPPVWNGGSATTSNWDDAANWSGVAIAPGNTLYFDGNNRLNNVNNTAEGTQYGDINFAGNAGAFVLNGNSVAMGGNIINTSTNVQTVNLGLSFGANYAFNGATDTLIIGGGVTNTANLTTLTLAGTGILSNRLASADGTTNVLNLTSNANWTLVDNASSTPIVAPWNLFTDNGTLNFGTASSAPTLTSTTPQGVPHDNQLGNAGGTATFNMVNGTLHHLRAFQHGYHRRRDRFRQPGGRHL